MQASRSGSRAVLDTELETEPAGRWRVLFVLSVGILLAEAPWFSSAAVTPLLREAWQPQGLELAMLTVAVQLGFAAGALFLAIVGAPDVIRGDRLFFWGAVITGAANLGFAWLATDPASALPFRFLTGVGIAAVYPVGMKLIAGWFRAGRGIAIGILIGALTVGTALPHLFRALGAMSGADWRGVVRWTSPGGVCRWNRRSRRRGSGSVRRTRTEVQPAYRRARVPRALGPAGEPRLPGPHVGALRDVDLGAALPGRKLRGGRWWRSGLGGSRRVRRDRGRWRRVCGRRHHRRPIRADDAHDRGDGGQRGLRRPHRVPVRRSAGRRVGPCGCVGDHGRGGLTPILRGGLGAVAGRNRRVRACAADGRGLRSDRGHDPVRGGARPGRRHRLAPCVRVARARSAPRGHRDVAPPRSARGAEDGRRTTLSGGFAPSGTRVPVNAERAVRPRFPGCRPSPG